MLKIPGSDTSQAHTGEARARADALASSLCCRSRAAGSSVIAGVWVQTLGEGGPRPGSSFLEN